MKAWSWTTLLSFEAPIGAREMIWLDLAICMIMVCGVLFVSQTTLV
jgi:hypothetical protein